MPAPVPRAMITVLTDRTYPVALDLMTSCQNPSFHNFPQYGPDLSAFPEMECNLLFFRDCFLTYYMLFIPVLHLHGGTYGNS